MFNVVFYLMHTDHFFSSSVPTVGQGYYTITFLSPKQKEAGVDDKPCDLDSSEKESVDLSRTDPPPDVGRVVEDNVSDPDHNEEPSGRNSTTGEPSSFPGTTSEPPTVAADAESRPAKISKKEQTAPASAKPRRGPGRPPKRALAAAPGKRGRGRPRKTPSAPLNNRHPADSSDDGATWHPGKCTSPDRKSKRAPARSTRLTERNSRRPLTRAALGKDFPSAKKRSWIDVERELEPDTIQE